MERAVELSRKGFPAPNPHVGCVIVKGGKIVGEGFHDHAGGPHAEIVALNEAGIKSHGSDVFVTLEPCNHTGRTGPCSESLIGARVNSVTIAVSDPNQKAGGGADRLRANGIKVEVGLGAAAAEAANIAWLTAMRRSRPYVVGKVATSLDGRIALPTGESQWITSEAARIRGHQLRAECGAVLVGRRTALVDDPLLTARIPGVVNQPVRIVLDRSGQLSDQQNVFNELAPTLRVVQPGAAAKGLVVPLIDGNFDLIALLGALFEWGLTGVLVEGGPATISHFVRARLIDRLHIFLAPKLLGAGTNWCQDVGVTTLAGAIQFELKETRVFGPDLELTFEPLQV